MVRNAGILAEAMTVSLLKTYSPALKKQKNIEIVARSSDIFEDLEYKADMIISVKDGTGKTKRIGIQIMLINVENQDIDEYSDEWTYDPYTQKKIDRKNEQLKSVQERYDYFDELKLVILPANGYYEMEQCMAGMEPYLKHDRTETSDDTKVVLPHDDYFGNGLFRNRILKECLGDDFVGIV